MKKQNLSISLSPEPASSARPTTRDRAQIPEELTWDLSVIYRNWETWEQGLEQLKEVMTRYEAFRGTLADGPERILAASLLSDELGQLAYRVYQYPSLTANQDTRDNAVQARVQRVRLALAEFHKATAWYTPELLTIPEATMHEWLDATPELAPYRFGIEETYRKQRHVLDEDGERLLAYALPLNGSPAQTYSMLANADVDFPTVTLPSGGQVVASPANYARGLRSYRDQADREAIFKGHYSVYNGHANTHAAIYNGVLQRDWFIAQARRYDTTLHAALDDNDIPVAVVEGLVDTARRGAGPLQRYHALRRQVLGLERYRDYDSYLPLLEVAWDVPYGQVEETLVASVALFGAEYQETVARAFSERWIDVYENEGKRSGAFSAGVYGVHPYMLLNYADTLEDAFTVAHEMGHTMHTVLSHANQPFATADYTIFVAEVASMTNEDLFLDRLLAGEDDPARRIVLLQHAIDDISAGFYRQSLFAAYELEAHRTVERGDPITADRLQEIYLGVLADFSGDALDDIDLYRNTWARIPHFFGSPYYVYQYATSKAAATLLHARMTSGPEDEQRAAVKRYLTLLSSGGNDHPVEQLRKAGVDFSTPEPMEALVTTMETHVSRLEQELRAAGLLSG